MQNIQGIDYGLELQKQVADTNPLKNGFLCLE